MFEKMLFSTDFSDYAQSALQCIAGFPGAREVILFHVVETARSPRGGGEISDSFHGAGEHSLREEKRYLEHLNQNLRVTTAVTTSSDTAGAIIEAAEKGGVSLIILGARGKSQVEGVLLGSVSKAVLRRAGTSVLIMRHRVIEGLEGKTLELFCPLILSRVLCPTDFSPASDQAIADLTTTGGVGEVVLLHVVSRGETEGEVRDAARAAEDQLDELRRRLAVQGISARSVVKIGDPALEITGTADEEDVSVIWMNSRGKGWVRELLLGSTAFAVSMNARRPVLIVRTPEERHRTIQKPGDDFIRA